MIWCCGIDDDVFSVPAVLSASNEAPFCNGAAAVDAVESSGMSVGRDEDENMPDALLVGLLTA